MVARPKKADTEKRTERLTVYLTPIEAERLNILASSLELDKTKIIGKALEGYVKQLADPPVAIRQAKHEQIMDQDREQVTGFICSRGHAFWLEWNWPSPPVSCPCCGEKDIKSTWAGMVTKGF